MGGVIGGRQVHLWLTQEEGGQGLVEYALVLLFIALAGVMALSKIAPSLAGSYNEVNNEFR